MKIRNNTTRNIALLSAHPKNPTGETGGAPLRLLVPALTTMEFTDEEYARCAGPAKDLISKKLLELINPPESTMSSEEIVAKIEKVADVKVSAKLGKKKLQKVAAKLDVET